MQNPDYERILEERGIDKHATPLTFEQADSVMRETHLIDPNDERASLHRFHFLAARMLGEGDQLPFSRAYAQTMDEKVQPTVTRTLIQWHGYYALATADLIGIPFNVDPRNL